MLKVGRHELAELLRPFLIFIFILIVFIYSGFLPVILLGIVNPIEAKVRKGKGAVGAYGNERTQQSLQDFPVVDSEEEEEKVHPKQYQMFCFVAEDVFGAKYLQLVIMVIKCIIK